MVNLVTAHQALLRRLMKSAGVLPHTVQINAGTVINIWAPSDTLDKPAVVLVHGFSADGIMTWQFQVGPLSKKYAVYVPDLLFFGGSATDSPDRSPEFQAECLAEALRSLGVQRYTVVGFSYGGVVALKMAGMWPDLVAAAVVSGSVVEMTESSSSAIVEELGFSSLSEFLLPTSVKECRELFKVAVHRKFWFPDRLYGDFLKVMFYNRKERAELLEGLVVTTKDKALPNFTQRIHLLWGENDQIFKMELARDMKQQLGEKTTLQGIKKAGHLVHLERPCVYNRCLKEFLASLHATDDEARK
ncbi:alpha/beta-Hydrolases superfamily protein [Striga hermonthica]|uniref:Alpha/beta-Hydrolases superfamily protein n=1 Tax=Striga hermonthica TaxID=68872 RepID=A0A9N7NWI2_STRHE|nr:alpha/beta-Hydrolases superfamily protein [Striga hermonthica]